MKRGKFEQRHTGRTSCVDGGKHWNDASRNQETPRIDPGVPFTRFPPMVSSWKITARILTICFYIKKWNLKATSRFESLELQM